jgi:hypothetical protein
MGTEPETTPVDVGVSDADLFAGATATEAPVDTPIAAEPEPPASDERPRNPDGTFAAKVEDKPAEIVPEVKPEVKLEERQENRIPLSEHLSVRERAQKAESEAKSERERREDLERRFSAMERANQPKPEPQEEPDPLLDPVGFREHMRREFREQLLGERREMSLRMAHRTHKEAFTEAYAEGQKAMASGDRALQARMQSSADPGETLIQWHQEQKTMKEVGGDPAAYRTRLLEDALKDPAYLAKAIAAANAAAGGNGARPAIKLPPSLSGAARADAHETNPSDLDVSDEGLFRHATAGMK